MYVTLCAYHFYAYDILKMSSSVDGIPHVMTSLVLLSGPVFAYKLRYIVGFGLVEIDISTNPKPAIYRNVYKNTGHG